jgi:hypothetical protein
MKKLLLALTFLVLLSPLHADAAMPPTNVHVKYNGSDVNGFFYAIALGCYPSDELPGRQNVTQMQHPSLLIEEYDASRNCTWYPAEWRNEVECERSLCEFYPRASPFRLAVYIPGANRTFLSGAVNGIGGNFQMNVSSSGEVSFGRASPTPNPFNIPGQIDMFLVASATVLTVVTELVTSFIYLHLRRLSKKILWSVILVNIISVPLLWLFLWIVSSDAVLTCLFLLVGEFAVFVFEAVVIFLINRKRMGLVDAFVMSFINNVASFLVGVALVLFTRL